MRRIDSYFTSKTDAGLLTSFLSNIFKEVNPTVKVQNLDGELTSPRSEIARALNLSVGTVQLKPHSVHIHTIQIEP